MRLLHIYLALLATTPSTLATICPPFIPTFPNSSPLGQNPSIQNFTSSLQATLNSLTRNTSYLGNPNTSFSLDVYSLTDSSPLLTYHFSAPNLVNASYGVSHVNCSTTYMIGSVTKIITIYTYLDAIGVLHWNEPIINFIPELASYVSSHQYTNETSHEQLNMIDWSSITIAQLASHLSGIPRSTAPSALSDARYQAAASLPAVPAAPGQFCNGSSLGLYPCSRNDTLANMLSRHPVHAPGTTPIYSNIAFQLIAWALEEVTGAKFDDLVADLIATLGLEDSYYPVANQSTLKNAIIPGNPTTAGYGDDMRSDAPSGAFYASINDMRKIGISVLDSTLLSPNVTQFWLKPVSFTADRYVSVGAPWEITQFPPDARFPVEVVSKAGDFGVYSAIMALMPEFGVGFTVLAAGQRASAETREVADLVVQNLVPDLVRAGYEMARGKYGGSYVDQHTNSSIVLKVSPGTEGVAGGRAHLQLVDWTWQGVPLLYAIGELLHIADPVAAGLQFNLYPTGLQQKFDNETRIESWRASYSTKGNDAVTGAVGSGPFSTMCDSWTEIDGFVYGGVGFDEFLLEIDAKGSVLAVNARVLQQDNWGKDKSQQRLISHRSTGKVRMVRSRREG